MTKNIVFDLNGVLFKPHDDHIKDSIKKQELSLILYMWGGKKVASALDTLAISILTRAYQDPSGRFATIKLHTGHPVPPLVCAWLTGEFSSQQALKLALNIFIHDTKADILSFDAFHQQLVKHMLESFFDPYILAATMRIVTTGLDLVQTAYRKKLPIAILSNWDSQSFAVLRGSAYGQELFHYFKPDNIVTSSQAGAVKPQPKIFDYFFNHTKLTPSTCLFIDDQVENIEAGQATGMQAVRYSPDSVANIKKIIENS